MVSLQFSLFTSKGGERRTRLGKKMSTEALGGKHLLHLCWPGLA